MGKIIGKVIYSGEKIKGALTDGKIYDCFGLSFGEIQIVDDENSAFWYSATSPVSTVTRETG